MFLRSLVVLVAAVLGSWIVGSGWWSHRGVPDRDLAFELQEERLLALAQRVAELPPEAREAEVRALGQASRMLLTLHDSPPPTGINVALPDGGYLNGPGRPGGPPPRPFWVVTLQVLVIVLLVGGAAWWWATPVVRDVGFLRDDLRKLGRENLTLRAREQRGPMEPIAIEVNRLAARVEQVFTAQKQMLEAVSHELRTPVARLQFRVEELRDLEGADGVLDRMEDDLSELNALLSELVTYLRVDVMDATCSDVEVHRMAARILERQAPLFPDVAGAVDGSVTWSVPRKALTRAVDNLIRNALRHARSKVIVIVTDLRVIVDDDGPGVSPLDRERIFEPFETVNRSRVDSGIGLGLPIVRRIAQKLGARVWVEDSPLGGARFVFERRPDSERLAARG